MGAMAYHRLSRILAAPEGQIIGESGHKSLDAIFEELAHRYTVCSEVLRDVKACLRARSVRIRAIRLCWLSTRNGSKPGARMWPGA